MRIVQISLAEGQSHQRKSSRAEPTSALMATLAITTLLSVVSPARAETPAQRPNIVVIWGDDIGQSNVSAYSHGLMGY